MNIKLEVGRFLFVLSASGYWLAVAYERHRQLVISELNILGKGFPRR